jgi:hypothetical protein
VDQTADSGGPLLENHESNARDHRRRARNRSFSHQVPQPPRPSHEFSLSVPSMRYDEYTYANGKAVGRGSAAKEVVQMGLFLVLVWIMVVAFLGFTVWISWRAARGMLSDLWLGHHPSAFRENPNPSRPLITVARFTVHTTPRSPRRTTSCTSHWSLTPLGAARVAGTDGSSADRPRHECEMRSNRKLEGRRGEDALITPKSWTFLDTLRREDLLLKGLFERIDRPRASRNERIS